MLDGLARALPELQRNYADPVVAEPTELDSSGIASAAFGLVAQWAREGGAIDAAAATTLLESNDAPGLHGGAHVDAPMVAHLASNMRDLGQTLGAVGYPNVRATLPACGVIESAHCDAVWELNLVEFKSVRRQLGVRDLRQLILYGVLAELGGEPRVSSLVLANPIAGVYCAFDRDELAGVIAGVTFPVLARDLADYLVGLGVSG